jgi:hypothetical protein
MIYQTDKQLSTIIQIPATCILILNPVNRTDHQVVSGDYSNHSTFYSNINFSIVAKI